MKNPRLFVNAALKEGAPVALDRAQAHYLGRVMRLRAGDRVSLFNGKDGEWTAVIETAAKNRVSAIVENQTRSQEAEHGPWLSFAPIKKTPTDFIVEKATELGVSCLGPVFTQNTNSTRINLDRLRAHAIEAAEQCQRLTVPEIADAVSIDQFIADWPKGRTLFWLDESGGGRPIVDVLSDLRDGPSGISHDCGFLSGPEGGFTVTELDALRERDFVVAVDLGPRVLRADTAALAALACWQAFFGSRR
ncbi:MAG: 16S rRNA (uracil(1498)-N(3))-methyltransferase [Rhodospirillales bacterium]|nr:16S rRNA (uracil(1498)-N(3))-methyltransferase [Rhodospirillales bacterium]